MFSGKTEELLRRLRRSEIAGKTVSVVKPSIDDRYSEGKIGSHNGGSREALVVDPESGDLEEVLTTIETDVLAIDEANFFENSLIGVVESLAESGKRVIVTGLDQNFRAEPFHPVPELMARADFVDKITAICVECGGRATRTQRLIDGEPAHESDPTILVGAEESYQARCRECHQVRKD